MSFLSARTKKGFTQVEVAEEMQVSDAAVSMWETGKTRPRASLLVKLAGLYGCTVDELLSGSDEVRVDRNKSGTQTKERSYL